jgi:hypothetical protein
MHGLLDRLVPMLGEQLLRDYHSWVQQQPKLLHDHEVEGDRSQCSNALSFGKPHRPFATRSYIAIIKNNIFLIY